jgi:uncharacterized protein (TIGR02118 family)
MVIFSVLYPTTEGARFDAAYYASTHIPLVKEAFTPTGLRSIQVMYGLAAADGSPAPYVAMAHLTFESADALKASVEGGRAAEVFADIPKYTDISPVMQVSAPA